MSEVVRWPTELMSPEQGQGRSGSGLKEQDKAEWDSNGEGLG